MQVAENMELSYLLEEPSFTSMFYLFYLCPIFSSQRVYRAGILQTLAILFLTGGREFVTSSDSVSRDSAERTLIAWDFQTTAKVSNQIYHVSKTRGIRYQNYLQQKMYMVVSYWTISVSTSLVISVSNCCLPTGQGLDSLSHPSHVVPAIANILCL